jgi:hypothetical protein
VCHLAARHLAQHARTVCFAQLIPHLVHRAVSACAGGDAYGLKGRGIYAQCAAAQWTVLRAVCALLHAGGRSRRCG